jgi:hypothetical protein
VNDEMFRQGFARGVVAVTGGGFNVLIDWRQRLDADGSPKPASRGTVHPTRSGVITQKTPQLFKKFNYRVVWADKSKGASKSSPSRVTPLANLCGSTPASWVILKAKPQGGGS